MGHLQRNTLGCLPSKFHNCTPTLAIPLAYTTKEVLHVFRPNQLFKPSNNPLIKLLACVLTKNNFEFNGNHYLKIGGTSIGTKTAQVCANVFMDKILSTANGDICILLCVYVYKGIFNIAFTIHLPSIPCEVCTSECK